MSMARAVSWAVRSQPSVQWTSTEDLCLSITSATFTAPPNTVWMGGENREEKQREGRYYTKTACANNEVERQSKQAEVYVHTNLFTIIIKSKTHISQLVDVNG